MTKIFFDIKNIFLIVQVCRNSISIRINERIVIYCMSNNYCHINVTFLLKRCIFYMFPDYFSLLNGV